MLCRAEQSRDNLYINLQIICTHCQPYRTQPNPEPTNYFIQTIEYTKHRNVERTGPNPKPYLLFRNNRQNCYNSFSKGGDKYKFLQGTKAIFQNSLMHYQFLPYIEHFKQIFNFGSSKKGPSCYSCFAQTQDQSFRERDFVKAISPICAVRNENPSLADTCYDMQGLCAMEGTQNRQEGLQIMAQDIYSLINLLQRAG